MTQQPNTPAPVEKAAPAEPENESLVIGQAQHLIGALMNHGLLPKGMPEADYLKLWDVVKRQLRCVNREGARAAAAQQAAQPVAKCSPTLTECPSCKNDFRQCPMVAQPVAPIKQGLTPDTQPVAGEPVWYAVTSKQAPIIDKAIRRLDVAQEYADKCSETYPGVEVIPLYTAAPAPVVLTASACCPVCGVNHPHAHTPKQVAHWLQAQAARFHMGSAIEVMTRWEADDLRQYKEAVDENNRRQVVEAYAGASASHAPVGLVPLTDDQIDEEWFDVHTLPVNNVAKARLFARAIEAAHGIKAGKDGAK